MKLKDLLGKKLHDKEVFDEVRDWQLSGVPDIRKETEEEAEERAEISLSRNRNKINNAR